MMTILEREASPRDDVEMLRRHAYEHGVEGQVAWCLSRLGNIELGCGHLDKALAYVREAQALAAETGHEAARVRARFLELSIAAIRGDLERVRREFSQPLGADDPSRALFADALLGFAELSAGDYAQASVHLEALAEATSARGIGEPALFLFRGDLIEARLATGRLDDARDALEWLEERGHALDRAWAIAVAGRCRALLLAAEHDLDGALAAVRQALPAHERLTGAFELARTLLVKGTIERRAKQKRAARESLGEALRIFEAYGAALWSAKVRDELARIGGRSRDGRLTPTEEQIAALVAAGNTNREVAEAMFVSVKTVEANLSRIYRKLGVSSRRELARQYAAQT
jgi:DNA-binding CsgD family transcriptional regulator